MAQPTAAASVLSSLSAISSQQRSLPLKLVEPAPGAAVTGNLLAAGQPGSIMPPEGVLVSPPQSLLAAPIVTTSTSTASPATVVSNKKVATEQPVKMHTDSK